MPRDRDRGTPRDATPPPPPGIWVRRHCQINVYRAEVASGGTRDHAAVTAFLHWFAASARRIRRVERETGWRSRLKVLWTAACMLRNRWAERADLNRCDHRSTIQPGRHRTASVLSAPPARMSVVRSIVGMARLHSASEVKGVCGTPITRKSNGVCTQLPACDERVKASMTQTALMAHLPGLFSELACPAREGDGTPETHPLAGDFTTQLRRCRARARAWGALAVW